VTTAPYGRGSESALCVYRAATIGSGFAGAEVEANAGATGIVVRTFVPLAELVIARIEGETGICACCALHACLRANPA